jgi:hypothetical protein
MHISHGSSEVNVESTGTYSGIVLASASGTPRSTHNVPTARAPHIRVDAGASTRASVVEITDEEDDTHRASSGTSSERCMWEADGSDAPDAPDHDIQQEELEPHGRKDAGKKKTAAARRKEQPRVVDVSDEDEDGAWVDVQDGAAEGEAGDGEEEAASEADGARTHRAADAFPARPQLVHTSTAYLDGPAVPILDVYGNVRGYRYPARAAQAQARAAAGQGSTAGGRGYAHFHGTPYLGSPGYVEYSAYSSTPAGGFNQVLSCVNNGSNNVSAVSISNCGNNDSVIHYEQGKPFLFVESWLETLLILVLIRAPGAV